jgi:hypothetical protein
MELIKAIKLYRKLRIEQEILLYKIVLWEMKQWMEGEYYTFPKINEYYSVNHAVKIIEKKLPKAYFIISDIFGGTSSLKKLVEKEKKVQGLSCLNL